MQRLVLRPEEAVLALRSFLEGEPILPIFIEVFLTTPCNQSCTFCISESYRTDSTYLPWDQLRLLLRELNQGGVRVVRFTGGGEPLLYPRIIDVLKECSDLNLPAVLVTNASRLGSTVLPWVVRACRGVKVSLDAGDEEAYAWTHRVRKGAFGRVLENVAALRSSVAATGTDCPIVLSFVLCEENFRTVDLFLDLAAELDVDEVVITTSTLSSLDENRMFWEHARTAVKRHPERGRFNIRVERSSPDEFLAATDLFCPIVLFTGVVTSRADLYVTCHHVRFPRHKMGNLGEDGLSRIVRSEAVMDYRSRYAFGSGEKCTKLLAADGNLDLVQAIRADDETIRLLRAHRRLVRSS